MDRPARRPLFSGPSVWPAVSYSDKTAIWFDKPTLTNQPLFQMPLLGYVTGYQGLLLFGVGLPAFFLMMGPYGLPAALAPLAAAAALAMVRPPVVGYEGRMAMIIWFYIRGGTRGGRTATSRALAVPRSHGASLPGKARPAAPRDGAAPAPVVVRATGRPVEISLVLRTRENRVSRPKVRILLDGASVKTAVPSPSGRVSVVLHPEDCTGTRKISVHEVAAGDDSTGAKLTEKEVVFRP